jgi:hypothetical protein
MEEESCRLLTLWEKQHPDVSVLYQVSRALDKCRMAAWESDWRATGPRWTTRR